MGVLLGTALKAARQQKGLTQQEVADALGISRPAVGQWEKGETEPSTENLVRVCDLLNINIAAATSGMVKIRELTPLQGDEPLKVLVDRRPELRETEDEFIRFLDDNPRIAGLKRDVPVFGVAVGGNDADFYTNGEIIDLVKRPAGIEKTKNVFAIYVVGSSMSPRYEEGELVYATSSRPASIGDYVIIELHPVGDDPVRRGFIKRLAKRTPTRIVCEQFNPAATMEFEVDRVHAVHRIIPWAELLGV